jgi:hypothetical protein
MSTPSVVQQRLRAQRVTGPPFRRPEEAVRWLGAVQAQNYAGAKWAVGQRVAAATDASVEEAFQRGKLIRTHVLRPTWHFVVPADLRWLLALTAPRVQAAAAHQYRQYDLDPATLRRAHAVLGKALEGGQHRTRIELMDALAAADLRADGSRLAHIMLHAELEALICSGPRRGKQFTYALVDERVPPAPARPRDEALAELTLRYFTSHGPALVGDCAGWSSLTVAEIKRGLAMNGRRLSSREIDGKTYWSGPAPAPARMKPPLVRLLPNYDELLVGYKDHAPTFTPEVTERLRATRGFLDRNVVVLDGNVVGGWQRALAGRSVRVETEILVTLAPAQRRALDAEIARYCAFVGLAGDNE